MHIDLSQEEKVDLLLFLSRGMGVSSDEILALYLLLGDRIFFLFDLLQGKKVKVPSVRNLQNALSALGGFKIQKLRKDHYLVNGVQSYRKDIRRGDVVSVSGMDLVALGQPQIILGEYYFLCKHKE